MPAIDDRIRSCQGWLIDLDGTLVLTESLHLALHTAVLERHGLHLAEADIAANVGRNDDHAFYAGVAARQGLAVDGASIAAWVAEKDDLTVDRFTSAPIPLRSGARELLTALHASHRPYGIVTSTRRDLAELVVRQAGLADLVPWMICFEDVPAHKPDPAPYRLGGTRLGLPPAQCLVIEDSLPGIRSAVAAGCPTIACHGLVAAEDLLRAGATALVDDLATCLHWLPEPQGNPPHTAV